MRRQTTALAIAVLLLASVAGAADEMEKLQKTTPAQRAKLQDALMQEKLALTADETPVIAAINLKYAEKMEPVIKGDLGMFARMRQMRAINGEKEAELKKALTPEQWKKYVAAKDEIKQKFYERIGAQP